MCSASWLAGCAGQPTQPARQSPAATQSVTRNTLDAAPPAPDNRTPAPDAAETVAQSSTDSSGKANGKPVNLWVRLRPTFRLPDCDSAPRATAWAHWYAGKEDYLNRVMKRAERVLYFIVEEVLARGMPGEIALLPVVESAFKPFALSPASAAGLWQFIPATGRRYGLKQTWWYDGRRDIYAATHAAIEYLNYLVKLFDGNWLLALASYNAGEGRVMRLIQRQKARGEPATFWAIDEYLPDQTRAYVPQLLGVACLIRQPERFNIELHPIKNKPQFKVVKIDGPINLALAAKLAGMKVKDLYWLNPAFNRWVTAPNGPHRLLLPVEHVKEFKRNLAQLPDDARVRWGRHTVEPGDTLWEIARRFNVSTDALRRMNDLNTSVIRVGQTLLVPRPAAPQSPKLLAMTRKLRAYQQRLGLYAPRVYTVHPGDTLWDIARRFDIGVARLAHANGMSTDDVLHIGETLRLPGTGYASFDQQRPARYTVRRGDTLWEIAHHFNVSVSRLTSANNIGAGDILHIGQTLRLPGSDAPLEAAGESNGRYTVQRGDSLWDIARRFDVSVQRLASLNNISDGEVLHIGETLRLPRAATSVAYNDARPDYYTVRSGDSLWEIARRFGIALEDLMRWNDISGSTILHPGQSLQLFQD